MENIPNDPIVECIMRTGYPPWFFTGKGYEPEDDDWEVSDGDVFYGNQTESF